MTELQYFCFVFIILTFTLKPGSRRTGAVVVLPARVALHCMAAAWGVAVVMRRVAP